MRANGVETAIARYREAGTKKDAHNRNCAQLGSAYLGVLLYSRFTRLVFEAATKIIRYARITLFEILLIQTEIRLYSPFSD